MLSPPEQWQLYSPLHTLPFLCCCHCFKLTCTKVRCVTIFEFESPRSVLLLLCHCSQFCVVFVTAVFSTHMVVSPTLQSSFKCIKEIHNISCWLWYFICFVDINIITFYSPYYQMLTKVLETYVPKQFLLNHRFRRFCEPSTNFLQSVHKSDSAT